MLKVLQDPFKKRLALSYLWDWVLVVIMTAAFFAIDKITPFHRMFSLEDKTIMFPYAEKESVPVWLLLVCYIFLIICINDDFNVYIDYLLCCAYYCHCRHLSQWLWL
jgi:hypothetical protein